MTDCKLWLKRAFKFFFENKLSNAELRTAYQEQQTKKSMILLAVYAVGNFGFATAALVPAIFARVRDNYDHRERFPELKQFYEPLNEDTELDANFDKMMRETNYVIAQYALLILLAIVSMVLLKKTKWYFRVLPYTLALMNVCAVPFWPVAHFKMCVLVFMGTMVFIITSVLFDGESLAQHLILVACELAVLLYRLKFVMPYYVEYDVSRPTQPLFWASIVLIIVGLISSDRTSDFKEAFMQKFVLQKQKEDFEEILNSFPEAALIVEDNHQDPEEANSVANESARPLEPERRDQDKKVDLPIVKMVNTEF